jgi:hypothetical protein
VIARLAARLAFAAALLAAVMVLLALLRGIDHDESQYVAATALVARGLLPYRDFAYLQTPLQPFVFAPVAALFGDWTWPALRIVNALLGAFAVCATWRAMRVAGANADVAVAAALLFACTDILLFSAGTARNDALPAALFAAALSPLLRIEKGDGSPVASTIAGLLLASAAAAKVSYALPALAYGLYALLRWRTHRPLWVIAGTLPPLALVGWTVWESPLGFWFGVIRFPAIAPADYYQAAGRAWKLGALAKALDTLKFLALGPALLAIFVVGRTRKAPMVLVTLVAVTAMAGLLPTPTWRQYWLPLLPPLFVLLALAWTAQVPTRAIRIAAVVFAVAGLAPSVEAVLKPFGMRKALEETTALRQLGRGANVATLSPQFLPATMSVDPRFATGPFYFRSTGLLPPPQERALHLISAPGLERSFAERPPALILVGGEGRWTSGDAALDRTLESWALAHGWQRLPLASTRLRLYAPPAAEARTLPAIAAE